MNTASSSSKRVVISQPFLFPWVGMLEQIKLAHCYVHYDDVRFSKGSFVNRVQIKTPSGSRWLTIPLVKHSSQSRICELQAQPTDWRRQHREWLHQRYGEARYFSDMIGIVDEVYALQTRSLSALVIRGLELIGDYFDLWRDTEVRRIQELSIGGSSSARVLAIVKAVGGTDYITGHGAKNYLNHEAFEREGVSVSYMDYERAAYPQGEGAFDPHVSSLDLIARCGPEGARYIRSGTVDWREHTR